MAGNQDAKGPNLERRIGRLEFAEGALVSIRWPVFDSDSAKARMITDVDVLTLDFDNRLRQTISIFECKSIRGEKGEPDRLLWLTGLQRLLSADRAVLVRESVSSRGRNLARSLRLETLDLRQVSDREQEHAWLPASFARIGATPFIDAEAKSAAQLKAIGNIPTSLLRFLRYEAMVDQPYRTLGALSTLAEIGKSAVLPDPAGLLCAGYAFQSLILAALRAASRLDSLGIRELARLIENGLRTGNPYDDRVLRLLGLADAVMHDQVEQLHRAYARQGGKRIPWRLPSVRAEAAESPVWLDRFLDLVQRFRGRASLARQLPQVAELACFDALLGNDAWRAPAFDHLFTIEHRQLLMVTLDAFGMIIKPMGDRLSRLAEIPFDRMPPVISDRRTSYEVQRADADEVDREPLANGTVEREEQASAKPTSGSRQPSATEEASATAATNGPSDQVSLLREEPDS